MRSADCALSVVEVSGGSRKVSVRGRYHCHVKSAPFDSDPTSLTPRFPCISAFAAATKALESASDSSDRRPSYDATLAQFSLADACLIACLGYSEMNCKQAERELAKAKMVGESALDVLQRDLRQMSSQLPSPQNRVDPTQTTNIGIVSVSTIMPATQALSIPIQSPPVPRSPTVQIGTINAPVYSGLAVTSATRTTPVPGQSLSVPAQPSPVPGSSTSQTVRPGEQLSSVEVEVYEESLEQAVETKTYSFESNSPLRYIIWWLTNPNDGLFGLCRHTQLYTRDEGRHTFTSDGLQFDWLTPDMSLRALPSRNGKITLCVVNSDKPYLVLVLGTDGLGRGRIPGAMRDRGLILKDYRDSPLHRSIPASHTAVTYYNRSRNLQYHIDPNDPRTWGSLPSNHVQECSADWLIVVPLLQVASNPSTV
ncbi:hypothetical protein FRB95_012558 [Tulasnella sp. JGI-2019a]|nr:hypothetical protein FRB95_012558 [Tulasnella sp. JGI-2019a]